MNLFSEKYNELKKMNFDEVNYDVILRTILECLVLINKDKISIESIFKIKEKEIEIRLLSNNKMCTPIYLDVFYPNVVDIQINNMGEYLYLYEIKSWKEIQVLNHTLMDLLKNRVTETNIKVGNSLKRTDFSVPYEIDGVYSNYKFATIRGGIWPWQQKIVEVTHYESWL